MARAVADAAFLERLAVLSHRFMSGGEAVKLRVLCALHLAGIPVRQEARLPARADKARSRSFRADIAVLNHGLKGALPLLVIEAKRYAGQVVGTRQRQNYARCGIPALHVGPPTVAQVVAAVEAFISGDATAIEPHLITEQYLGTGVGGLGGSLLPSGPEASNGTSQTPTERSEVSTSVSRTTWLTPYCHAYRDVYGGSPVSLLVKRMAAPLRELEIELPRDEVVRRFRNYMRATPARYYSVEHFAKTYPAWAGDVGPSAPGVPDPLPGEDIDAYMARLTRGVGR